jgi:hypothetical protein
MRVIKYLDLLNEVAELHASNIINLNEKKIYKEGADQLFFNDRFGTFQIKGGKKPYTRTNPIEKYIPKKKKILGSKTKKVLLGAGLVTGAAIVGKKIYNNHKKKIQKQ